MEEDKSKWFHPNYPEESDYWFFMGIDENFDSSLVPDEFIQDFLWGIEKGEELRKEISKWEK